MTNQINESTQHCRFTTLFTYSDVRLSTGVSKSDRAKKPSVNVPHRSVRSNIDRRVFRSTRTRNSDADLSLIQKRFSEYFISVGRWSVSHRWLNKTEKTVSGLANYFDRRWLLRNNEPTPKHLQAKRKQHTTESASTPRKTHGSLRCKCHWIE